MTSQIDPVRHQLATSEASGHLEMTVEQSPTRTNGKPTRLTVKASMRVLAIRQFTPSTATPTPSATTASPAATSA